MHLGVRREDLRGRHDRMRGLFCSSRGRRSPKQRMKEQLNGGVVEADKDQLISEDSDAAYRKCPGVNNVAYVVRGRPLCGVDVESPPG